MHHRKLSDAYLETEITVVGDFSYVECSKERNLEESGYSPEVY